MIETIKNIKEKIKINSGSNNTGRKRLYYLSGAAISALVVVLIVWPSSQKVEIYRVQRGPYEQTIQEDGTTRVHDKFTILSPYSGQLLRIDRHAGDTVRKGDVVAVILWDQQSPVRSPENGVILQILRADAGPIEMGRPIMEIGNTAFLEIVIDVLTSQAVNISKGNPVRILRWGGPKPLEAKVRVVEPSAFVKISSLGVEERRVRVVADFVSPREEWTGLGDNFRLDCQIVVYRQENALRLHTGAIFRDGEEGWAVFKIVDGKARRTPIKTSRRGQMEALIESGLALGDDVILYPADTIRDGVRVKGL